MESPSHRCICGKVKTREMRHALRHVQIPPAAQLFVADAEIAATKRLGHRKRQGGNVGHDHVEPYGQEQGKEGVHEGKHVR